MTQTDIGFISKCLPRAGSIAGPGECPGIGDRGGNDGVAWMGVAAAVLIGEHDHAIPTPHPGHGVRQKVRSGKPPITWAEMTDVMPGTGVPGGR